MMPPPLLQGGLVLRCLSTGALHPYTTEHNIAFAYKRAIGRCKAGELMLCV